jgi:hypothetical protein
MSDFNQTKLENPDGGMGPHGGEGSQEEGANRGTAVRPDGGLGPHSSAPYEGGKGPTPDGGLGPHS